MLSEKELLDLVSSIIPIGEDNAVHLGPSLIEQLQVSSSLYRIGLRLKPWHSVRVSKFIIKADAVELC